MTNKHKIDLLPAFKKQFTPETVQNVFFVNAKIRIAGFEMYLVGGTVRDLILGRNCNDIDMCTNMPIELLKDKFKHVPGASIIDTGIEHGTVTIHFEDNGDTFEITRFRKDVATDGRRATVAFTDELSEDLERRDLTINAIAWDPKKDYVLSYSEFDGVEDIRTGNLQFIGDAVERINEDHLRALRYLRFSVQLSEKGFSFNDFTWTTEVVKTFQNRAISFERVVSELEKMFKFTKRMDEKQLVYFSEKLSQLRIFSQFKITEHEEQDVLYDIFASGSFLSLIRQYIVKNGDVNISEIKMKSEDTSLVKKLMKISDVSFDKRQFIFETLGMIKDKKIFIERVLEISVFYGFSAEWAKLIRLEYLKIEEEGIPLLVSDLEISGNDAIELGYKGKEIGDVLDFVLNRCQYWELKNKKSVILKKMQNLKLKDEFDDYLNLLG